MILGCDNMKVRRRIIKIVIALIILVILVGAGLFVKEMIFSGEAKVIYGSRTKGVDKMKISDETKNKIKTGLGEATTKVEVRVTGRLIYIIVKVKDGTTLDVAKSLAVKSLEFLSDEEKAFYDVQMLIESEGESAQFPIIGYKQKSRANFSWTKDRAGS